MTTTVLAYIPSPPQGVWYLGPFPLRAYALCIIVGIVAALVIGDRRWTARGGEPGVIYDVALWAVPFGLIGGRAYHVMTDWRTYFGEDGAGFGAALRIWDGGLGIWGAVALGGIGAWIACRRRGIPLPAFGDAIAPGIILAQAIGRVGNYFNQELFGRETTLPWGLEIYERVNSAGQLDMLNGVSTGQLALDYAVHPTFLYELLWNLLVFAVLILVDRRFRIGHGRLFALYVAGYCVGRFWIELMRSDTATLLAGIRINTFTATFVFIGAVVYIMVAPKGREDPATLRGNVDDEARVEEFAVATVAAATGVAAAAKIADEDDAREAADTPDAELEPAPELEPESGESDSARLDAGGFGPVEGEEAVEAAEGAPTVHDAAVEGAADAGALAAQLDVSGDAETEADGTATSGEDSVAPPLPSEAGGMGTVEGDEASEAAAGAAAAGVAVASNGGTNDAEPETDETDTDAASEGLGSVEGDEVAASVEDADQVHEAAVAGEADAEELAADVEAEPETGSEGLGSVEGNEVAASVGDAEQVHEAAVAGEADAVELAAEVEAEPETGSEGLGSVEGDEVAASVGDAEQVHEAAVAGEADAVELTADVEAEDGAETTERDEADEVSEQADEQSSIEGVDAAEALTAGESTDETSNAPETTAAPDVTREATEGADAYASRSQRAIEAAGRVRQWVRRRRNR